MKYIVKDFKGGLYEFDTLFIQVDNEIIQIPVLKDAEANEQLIGKSIIIKDLYSPIEKIVIEETKPTK